MLSVNKVTLLGYVGRDPEVKEISENLLLTTFSVATSEKNQKGEEITEWFNIVAWNKLAQIAWDHIKKGQQVYIEGKFKTEKYETKEGVEKSSSKIIAEKIILLGKKSEKSEATNAEPTRGRNFAPAPAPMPSAAAPARKYQAYRQQPELMANASYSNDYPKAPYNQEIF